ncbi:MAG: twin-arginine translocation signal domain-containing protein [Verrucomicrobiae bacterium]|nr:twin-arginine translocation signal domain-containing protein [Verrucomicrobiae bacterium]
MCPNRCAARCHARRLSRRDFLRASTVVTGATLLGGSQADALAAGAPAFAPCGPGSKCVPAIRVAFVRRKGDYGMRWPGQVYDGEAARALYTRKIQETAAALKMNADIRPAPLYSLAESEAWIGEAKAAKPDGLLVVLLDRQEHAWPTAARAMDSGIPTVVYSPLGSSFTSNTAPLAEKTGAIIYATDDFTWPAYGMKMLHAGARMRATRIVVIQGKQRREAVMPDLGIQLRYVPASTFTDLYKSLGETDEMRALAAQFIRRAKKVIGATRQDVINGAHSYVVARKIMEQEQADGISMDCLGALGPTRMSLPCLAWSRMNYDSIPAGCEADIGAVGAHVICQYLFDRPGFQQDPVPETARKAIIGAHCSCPTKLNGFDKPAEPYVLRHHHAERDATAHPQWRIGQPVTSLDVLPAAKDKPTTLIISSGRVLENMKVPPAGGCVISVMVKFDGVEDVLSYPGFHQVFFYGNFRQHLVDFCRLFKLQPQVV